MTGVPRVAAFDDLRVGQWVAWQADLPQAGVVTRKSIRAVHFNNEGKDFTYIRGDVPTIGLVILRDAPEPPVTVRRDLLERLGSALDDSTLTMAAAAASVRVDAYWLEQLTAAARALIDNAEAP